MRWGVCESGYGISWVSESGSGVGASGCGGEIGSTVTLTFSNQLSPPLPQSARAGEDLFGRDDPTLDVLAAEDMVMPTPREV